MVIRALWVLLGISWFRTFKVALGKKVDRDELLLMMGFDLLITVGAIWGWLV